MARSVALWIGKTDDAMPHKAVRERLLRQQGDRCACCGMPFGPKRLARCDHIVPLINDGPNCETNLQMICTVCHDAKTAGEATERAKTRDIRQAHLMAPIKKPGGFRLHEPQRTASRRINKFSPIDGVYEEPAKP